jgi:hypothetical protein
VIGKARTKANAYHGSTRIGKTKPHHGGARTTKSFTTERTALAKSFAVCAPLRAGLRQRGRNSFLDLYAALKGRSYTKTKIFCAVTGAAAVPPKMKAKVKIEILV